MGHNFGCAMKNAASNFAIYALSFIAAIAWNTAVQDEIKKHDEGWKRWVWAIGCTVLALVVITLIVVFDDSNSTSSSKTLESERVSNASPAVGPALGRAN